MRNKRFFNKHKYKAQRSKCLEGHSHPSKLEGQYCNQLQLLKKNGDIKDFIYEKRFELRVNGKLITTHKPDFFVTRNDGTTEVHECKGLEMAIWVLKKKLFEAVYPEIPYIVIK